MRTTQQIAAAFGCRPSEICAQFVKNHEQLRAMYLKASQTGRRVNGFTSEQLRHMMVTLKMKGTK